MKSKKLEYLIFFSVFLGIPLLLFREGIFGGRFLYGDDTVNIYLPVWIFAKRMLFEYGALPFWMPNMFFGMPILDSSILIYWYPTNLFFMLLPFKLHLTYSADAVIHLFAAGTGMFMFLRLMNIRKEASILGGLFFMMSGMIISYIAVGHWNNIKAACLIPWTFYFFRKGIIKQSIFNYMMAAAVFALQVFATGMQIMAYNFMALFFYGVYEAFFLNKHKSGRLRITIGFAVTLLMTVVLSAIHLFPALRYSGLSWRGDFSFQDFISWSFHPSELLTFLLPGFFGLAGQDYWGHMPFNATSYFMGVIPLLLLPLAFMPSKHKRTALFFIIVSGFFTVLAFGKYTPLYGILYHIPVFKGFRNPGRFFYIATFFVSVLSAIAVHNIFETTQDREYSTALKGNKLFKYGAITAGAGLVLFLIFLAISTPENLENSYRAVKGRAIDMNLLILIKNMAVVDIAWYFAALAVFSAILYGAVRGKIKSAAAACAVLGIFFVFEAGRVDSKFIRYTDFERIVPAHNAMAESIKNDKDIFRTADFTRAMLPNASVYYDFESATGYHGVLPLKYYRMQKENMLGNIMFNRIMNIKYFFTGQDVSLPGLNKLADGKIKVYEDSMALPRAYVAESVLEAADDEEIIKLLKTGGANNKTAIIKTGTGAGSGGGIASIIKYTPNRIMINAEAKSRSILIISNMNYPAWKAKVNEKDAEVFDVNYIQSGVMIDKGMNTVELYYSKKLFLFSLLITLAGIAVVLYFLFRERKKHSGFAGNES